MCGAMVECVCDNPKCKAKFMARVADRTRGWARCCCKSCAATMNNKKTGNYARFCELRDKATSKRYVIKTRKISAVSYLAGVKFDLQSAFHADIDDEDNDDEYETMPGEDECDWGCH